MVKRILLLVALVLATLPLRGLATSDLPDDSEVSRIAITSQIPG